MLEAPQDETSVDLWNSSGVWKSRTTTKWNEAHPEWGSHVSLNTATRHTNQLIPWSNIWKLPIIAKDISVCAPPAASSFKQEILRQSSEEISQGATADSCKLKTILEVFHKQFQVLFHSAVSELWNGHA